MSNIYLERLHAKSQKALVTELPKLPKGAYDSFGSTRTNRIHEIEAANDAALADLLRQHGGFSGVHWDELVLIDATTSSVWIVQRPDRLLTVLCTVGPIPKPASYSLAWPARFTSPEPIDESAPAAEEAAVVIAKVRQSCWVCRHLDTSPKPACAKGHSTAWRLRCNGTQFPSRVDQAGGCNDGDETP